MKGGKAGGGEGNMCFLGITGKDAWRRSLARKNRSAPSKGQDAFQIVRRANGPKSL